MNKSIKSIALFLLAMLIAGGLWSCKKAPDTTPPAEVTGLTIVNGSGSVTLSWTDPADPDFEKVEICYYTQDGMACFGVLKGVQEVERSLHSGTEYLFVVKTIDKAGNKSAGVSAKGMPDRR